MSDCALALHFSQDHDFPGSNLITANHGGKLVFLIKCASLRIENSAGAILSRLQSPEF
jgi:hypothetical protein